DVPIATERLAAFDLISIGDETSIDDDASLFGYTVEDGELVIGPVEIGRRCFAGTWSILCAGTIMEDGARLEDLSLLPSGTRVPKGETWTGSPARLAPRSPEVPAPRPARGPIRRAAIAALYAGLVLVMPIVLLAALVPGDAVSGAVVPRVGRQARPVRRTLDGQFEHA